jgi:hypothetical protein
VSTFLVCRARTSDDALTLWNTLGKRSTIQVTLEKVPALSVHCRSEKRIETVALGCDAVRSSLFGGRLRLQYSTRLSASTGKTIWMESGTRFDVAERARGFCRTWLRDRRMAARSRRSPLRHGRRSADRGLGFYRR